MHDDLDIGPFLELIAQESRIKVFHAARQDMEIFNRLIGHPPGPIFDTQVAAMALGLGDSISYDNLIKRVLKRDVDKSSQFTDWTRRPLSEKQRKYALGDVTHLRDAFIKMRDELNEKGRWNWALEEMHKLEDPEVYDTDPANAWKRLKLRKPKKEYLAVLAAVAKWRESKAQELDKPRRRLLKDDAIHEIADQKPTSPEAFDQLRAVPNGFIRSRNAEGLADAVAAAIESPNVHAPKLPPKKTNPQTPAGAPEMLKVLLKHVSEEADVVPRLIANAADIEAIARGERAGIPAFEGWRKDLFGERAAALMNGKLALSFEDGAVRLFEV
jgi:ribonuclease D